MAELKVAHLLPDYNPFPPQYAAGTELRVARIARLQSAYCPLVICGAFDEQPEREPIGKGMIRRVRINQLYRRIFQKITRLDPYSYADRVNRIMRSENVNILHVHNENKLLHALSRHLRSSPLPVILHVANERPVFPQHEDLVTRWVACSNYIKNDLINKGIAADKISVIYTGVDSRLKPCWQLDEPERSALRAAHGINEPNAIVLLFAARLVREKGLSELLSAFTQLRQQSASPLYLLVAGNVRESNDPANEKANYGREMVQRMGKTVGVKWVGSLHPARVHDFMLSGDIFVLPSLWHDPFPTVMLEAAAAGLPIAGSKRGGIPEFLSDCPGIPLVETPESPEEWIKALKPLINDANIRRKAGHFLRKRIDESYSWERVCKGCERLYDQLLTA